MYMICLPILCSYSFKPLSSSNTILQFPRISRRSRDHIRSLRYLRRASHWSAPVFSASFFSCLQALTAVHRSFFSSALWFCNQLPHLFHSRASSDSEACDQEITEGEKAGADGWEERHRSHKDWVWSQKRREFGRIVEYYWGLTRAWMNKNKILLNKSCTYWVRMVKVKRTFILSDTNAEFHAAPFCPT